MTKKLFVEAVLKFIFGLTTVILLIFLPAGTTRFWRGWLFLAVCFIPMFFAGIIMMFKNPSLLKRRLKLSESRREQAIVIKLSAFMFILGFIVAGLDFRFGWSKIKLSISIISAVIFLLLYLLYAEVLRENIYLSRTVEISEGQRVIDTGLYSIVRHPMYSITVLLFLTIPLILGSIFSFVIFLVYPFLLVKRIINEEVLLENELPAYHEYQKKVKYRLIPFIW